MIMINPEDIKAKLINHLKLNGVNVDHLKRGDQPVIEALCEVIAGSLNHFEKDILSKISEINLSDISKDKGGNHD